MSARRLLLLYVSAVALFAAGGLLYDGSLSNSPVFGHYPAAFWMLVACGLGSDLLPRRWLALDHMGQLKHSWTFIMATLLIASPLAAVEVAAVLIVLADVRAGKEPADLGLSVANIVLSLSVGELILEVTGQTHQTLMGHIDFAWFPVAAIAFVAVIATFSFIGWGAAAISDGTTVRAQIREYGIDSLQIDGMLVGLAPIFVLTAERSLVLVLPLLVMTAIVYRTARLAVSRRYDSTHDLLTGVANRRMFDQKLPHSLAATESRGDRLALVLLDLDGFKAVNDHLGHQIGDQVLVEVAHRLQATCRPGDGLARLGGDEFALTLPNIPAGSSADDVAWRILDCFTEPIEIEGIPVAISASAGVALAPEHGLDPQVLLRRADEAMYSAKRAKNTVHVYRPSHGKTALGRLGLLNDLAGAMETNELFLEYQPQVAMSDSSAIGAEALIRWRHPEVGLVPPGAFMPLAEQTELIGAITERVLREALGQTAQWLAEGRNLTVAVNVSVRNLEHPDFPNVVERQLRAAGVSPRNLVVELTENTMALERATVREGIHKLRDLGTGVAIDDFGTGYSSIVQLRELPVDQIKLDRQFVHRMADDARDALIVRAILQLAAALGVSTVAEGVEDELVATLLRDLGCEQAQGFFFARPMRPDDFSRWLDRRNRWSVPANYTSLTAGN